MHVLPTLAQSDTTINLSAVALDYVRRTNEAAPSMAFCEAMAVELAQIERITGDSEFGECELAYAYKIAADEPVSFSDLPPCLWP
jgi:hypothetical protein